MNLQRKKNPNDNTGKDLVTTMFKLPRAYHSFESLRFASEAVMIRFLPRERRQSFGNDIPSERKKIREL